MNEDKIIDFLQSTQKKSRILRKKTETEIKRINSELSDGLRVLDEIDAISVKRILESRFLGFPKVVRGLHGEGSISRDGAPVDGEISRFIDCRRSGYFFLYFNPWLLNGAVISTAQFIISNIGRLLEYSDYSIDIYGGNLDCSCIFRESESDNLIRFEYVI